MTATKDVMVLDDEPIVGDRLKPALEKQGFQVEVYTDSSAAIERLRHKQFSVLVTDVKMRGPSGMDVLRFVREVAPGTHVIVITGYATIETQHEATALGAVEFIAKPFRLKDIVGMVSKSMA